MKASELKKHLTKISLMSNEIAIKDAITILMQKVKVISYEESQIRTALSIDDKEEVVNFLLEKMITSEAKGKTDLIKITAKTLKVSRRQADALFNQMISDGTIVKDRDAPRTCNRSIIYKPA
ncbi:MAG: hypothetical protein [Bacteriophage sp.]|nr:MAG: hypothetical protein [Bacteriophage sp.]